jgi:hypothetical protein
MQPTPPQPHDPYNYQPPQPQVNYGAYPVPMAPPVAQPQQHATLPATDLRARNAAIALIVCGVALLVGLVSHGWFSARGDGSVGLLGVEECRRTICRSMSWFDIERAPAELKLFATVGILGFIAAIAMIIQATVMLLKRQPQRVALIPLNATLGIAAFGAFSFFFHLTFGELSHRLSVSWAGLVAMGGIIAASIIIATMIRPLMKQTSST